MSYVIMKTDYDEDKEVDSIWFLEKRKGCNGWTDDETYCATKFTYPEAVKELFFLKKTAGYGCRNFFKSDITIETTSS